MVRKHGTLLRTRRGMTVEEMARSEFRKCEWVCRGPVRAARFSDRRSPSEFAIVHPSTKKKGDWQVSYFDSEGPVGDTRRRSCSEAVALLAPWAWRLRQVE